MKISTLNLNFWECNISYNFIQRTNLIINVKTNLGKPKSLNLTGVVPYMSLYKIKTIANTDF